MPCGFVCEGIFASAVSEIVENMLNPLNPSDLMQMASKVCCPRPLTNQKQYPVKCCCDGCHILNRCERNLSPRNLLLSESVDKASLFLCEGLYRYNPDHDRWQYRAIVPGTCTPRTPIPFAPARVSSGSPQRIALLESRRDYSGALVYQNFLFDVITVSWKRIILD
jgi:hypothetical protein